MDLKSRSHEYSFNHRFIDIWIYGLADQSTKINAQRIFIFLQYLTYILVLAYCNLQDSLLQQLN